MLQKLNRQNDKICFSVFSPSFYACLFQSDCVAIVTCSFITSDSHVEPDRAIEGSEDSVISIYSQHDV